MSTLQLAGLDKFVRTLVPRVSGTLCKFKTNLLIDFIKFIKFIYMNIHAVGLATFIYHQLLKTASPVESIIFIYLLICIEYMNLNGPTGGGHDPAGRTGSSTGWGGAVRRNQNN